MLNREQWWRKLPKEWGSSFRSGSSDAVIVQVLNDLVLCNGSLFLAALDHVSVLEQHYGWQTVNLEKNEMDS